MLDRGSLILKPCTTIAEINPTAVATRAKPEPDRDGKPTTEEKIRLGAYLKWEAAGKPEGNGVDFWLEAEKDQLLQTRKLKKP